MPDPLLLGSRIPTGAGNATEKPQGYSQMRIVDIRECAIPLQFEHQQFELRFLRDDDLGRGGADRRGTRWQPVTGFSFNSTGRYACGATMRARFIPRILRADPRSLLDETGENFDPAKILAIMMQREKSGGHSERSIAIGTIEVAIWDAVAKIAENRCIALLAERYNGGSLPARCFATWAAAGISRARPSATCRTRCAAISMPATPW